jgi:uncharacterized protein YecE (DUF72 family)
MALYAGTSGFGYPTWKPRFYPEGTPAKKFLQVYAQRLNCVESNYSFRRLVAASTLESWIAATPADFLFALKAHQRITHMLRLKDARESTELFLKSVDPLQHAKRLGPILFQLPPNMSCDIQRLVDFLALLRPGLRYAFEFRHVSWLAEPVYRLLQQYNVALCWAESEKFEVPKVTTADFVYFRLRKAEYPAPERKAILNVLRNLKAEGKDAFVFFKHEDTPDGALYAEELLRAL